MAAKILLIDDDRTFVVMVQSILGKEGYDVLSAPDGKTGFDLVVQDRPDVLLLDVLMPGMTGYEFFQKLKKEGVNQKRMPTIVISSRQSMQDFFETWEVFGFLTKPFKPDELIEKVKGALAQKERYESFAEEMEPDEPAARQKALVIGFEDYILDKVRGFLENMDYEVDIATKKADVISQAEFILPSVIVSQFHRNRDLWDIAEIRDMLANSEKAQNIPLLIFCTSDMATEALKLFKSSQVVHYGNNNDLERNLEKHIEKLQENIS